jgi:hypothetical protein
MAGKNTFEIVGEFIDHISPALNNLSANTGVLQSAIAGLAGGLAAGAALAVFEKLGEAIGEIITAIPKLTMEAIENADAMGKMAQRTGVALEELQSLTLAAELADVSTGELASGLAKISKSLSMADGNGESKQALTFKAHGIDIHNANGELISSREALVKISEYFAKTENGANKTAIAMALGGKALVQMIPMINKGAEDMEKLAKVSEGLSANFTPEQTAQSELFNDSLRLIAKAFESIGSVLAKSILPGISTLAEYLAKGAEEGGIINTVMYALGETLGFLLKFLSPLIYGFATITAFIKAMAYQIEGLGKAAYYALNLDFDKASAALDAMEEKTKKTYTDLAEFLDKSQNPEKYAQVDDGKKPQGVNPEALVHQQKLKEEFDKAYASLQKELTVLDQTGKTSEVIFQTQEGQWKKFNANQKEKLIALAREIDYHKLLSDILKQELAAADALETKFRNAEVAGNAALNMDPKDRAGYLAAQQQLTVMNNFLDSQTKIAEKNKDKTVRERLLEEIKLEREKYQVGSDLYIQAQKAGEYEFLVANRTKTYNTAIGDYINKTDELTRAKEYYDILLSQGLITQERYNDLVFKSSRDQRELTNSLTATGRAFEEVVKNRDGMYDIVIKMSALSDKFKDGSISAEEYKLSMHNLQSSYDNLNPRFAINQVQKLEDSMKSAAASFESMFSNGIFDIMQGKWTSLGDLVKTTIDRMVANMLAAQLQFALFGDLGSTPAGKTPNSTGLLGQAFMSFFGGFREGGGDVNAGMAYVVGEKRPEIFVPKTNGTIIPNTSGATGGSGGQPVNITIHAMDSQSVMQALGPIKRELVTMLSTTQRNYNQR